MANTIFKDKTLLITGGTGSFGHTVLKHFLTTDIGEIRIFSRDEKKQDDMRHELQANYPDYYNKVKFYIGDVRNIQSLRDVMPGVNFIFHAAALKQVPSCEFFPMEAVRTNIEGTDNMLHAAIEAGVERVVCLSTDKAAYPINAMGISKAMMEHVITANARVSAQRGGPVICCTRYGNVMCSRGSVIPLFVEQIKAGNPITITDPNMTRFLMNLDEAVDLVGRVRLGNADGFGKLGDRRASEQMNDIRGKGFRRAETAWLFPHGGKQLLIAEQAVFAEQRLDGLKQHGNSFHCIKYFN